jgi:hypothetical protein
MALKLLLHSRNCFFKASLFWSRYAHPRCTAQL